MTLAIRTAKRPPILDDKFSHADLDKEIDYAVNLASAVLGWLHAKKEALFPSKRESWYQVSDEDMPKC